EEEVAIGNRGRLAAQPQHAPEPQTRGDRRGRPGAVRLERPHGDEGVRALAQGLVDEVLELADLVAALGEPGQVVALDVQLDVEGRTEPRQRLDRSRCGGEPEARPERTAHRPEATARGASGSTKNNGPGLENPGRSRDRGACRQRQLWAQYPGTHWYPFQYVSTQYREHTGTGWYTTGGATYTGA